MSDNAGEGAGARVTEVMVTDMRYVEARQRFPKTAGNPVCRWGAPLGLQITRQTCKEKRISESGQRIENPKEHTIWQGEGEPLWNSRLRCRFPYTGDCYDTG